jgi:hypothetical protein
MKTVYKYSLGKQGRATVKIPEGAKVLHVAVQREDICLWALVDTEQPSVERTFTVYGTGHEAFEATDQNYVGTFLIDNGLFVFHVFEVTGAETR